MTKMKINAHLSIRTDGKLYCLTDLYKFMDMRNDRLSPEHWATDRKGSYVVKQGWFRKVYCGPTAVLIKRGFFRKTCWAQASVLLDYAQSLTPGILKEVEIALGIPQSKPAPKKETVYSPSPTRSLDKVIQDVTRPDPGYEAMIQRAERRVQPARRTQPVTRGQSQGSRGTSSARSFQSQQNDNMLMQAVVMQSILDDSSSRSSHSHSSHSSHSYSHHSSHDSGSYDSGSSDSGGGGSCD